MRTSLLIPLLTFALATLTTSTPAPRPKADVGSGSKYKHALEAVHIHEPEFVHLIKRTVTGNNTSPTDTSTLTITDTTTNPTTDTTTSTGNLSTTITPSSASTEPTPTNPEPTLSGNISTTMSSLITTSSASLQKSTITFTSTDSEGNWVTSTQTVIVTPLPNNPTPGTPNKSPTTTTRAFATGAADTLDVVGWARVGVAAGVVGLGGWML